MKKIGFTNFLQTNQKKTKTEHIINIIPPITILHTIVLQISRSLSFTSNISTACKL